VDNGKNGEETRSELKGNIGLSSKAKLGTGLIGYHQGEEERGKELEEILRGKTHIDEKKELI
jgi:hypothetical protein